MPGIVIEPRKLVYWPIPKCACTAIKVAIAQQLGLEFTNPHTAPFTWTDAPIPGYQDFAVVRHPAIRLYSLWINKLAPGHPVGPKMREAGGMDLAVFGRHLDRFRDGMGFDEFVREVVEIPYDQADPHWAPQSRQAPLEARPVKLEDAGLLLRAITGQLNASEYDVEWVAKYGTQTWRLIRDYYAEDFARFGYIH